MKNVIFALIATASTMMQAQEAPYIIGHIVNKDLGQITFTTSQCAKSPDRKVVFVRDSGGKISLQGCWVMVEEEVWVLWNDGDLYSYPIAAIQFSPQFDAWYESRNRPKYQ